MPMTINNLPDDIINYEIKEYISPASSTPKHLTLEEILYILWANECKTTDLVVYCRENGIKQSGGAVTGGGGYSNQYIKRLNILTHLFKRTLSAADKCCVYFTRLTKNEDHPEVMFQGDMCLYRPKAYYKPPHYDGCRKSATHLHLSGEGAKKRKALMQSVNLCRLIADCPRYKKAYEALKRE